MTRILVIDNYDSFVHNVVHYLAQIGAEVEIWRNDDARFVEPGWVFGFDGLLISPGPGTPQAAGVSVEVVRSQAGRLPIFGICLGLQAIAVAHGAVVGPAGELLHGKTSRIEHDGRGVFAGLPAGFTATRYHSLAVQEQTLPAAFEVSARADGVIMAIRHRELPIEAVQFHPESVLTECGYQLLGNWLAVCGDTAAPSRAARLSPLMALNPA